MKNYIPMDNTIYIKADENPSDIAGLQRVVDIAKGLIRKEDSSPKEVEEPAEEIGVSEALAEEVKEHLEWVVDPDREIEGLDQPITSDDPILVPCVNTVSGAKGYRKFSAAEYLIPVTKED